MSILKIKPVNEETAEFYANHSTYNEGDSGIDLFCPEDIEIKPFETKLVSMKIKCEMTKDSKNISYYLYPRSSISKTPLMLANSVGIIDAGYRGEIKVALRYCISEEDVKNLIKNVDIKPYKINRGDRLVQICSPTLKPLSLELVDTLSESERGEGGFGSTGK
jgi:dUTP pyrophosphatase